MNVHKAVSYVALPNKRYKMRLATRRRFEMAFLVKVYVNWKRDCMPEEGVIIIPFWSW